MNVTANGEWGTRRCGDTAKGSALGIVTNGTYETNGTYVAPNPNWSQAVDRPKRRPIAPLPFRSFAASPCRPLALSPSRSLPLVDQLLQSFPEARILRGPAHKTELCVANLFAGPGSFSVQMSGDKGRNRAAKPSADPLEPLELSYRCVVNDVKNALPPVTCGQAKSGNRIISMNRVDDPFTMPFHNSLPGK